MKRLARLFVFLLITVSFAFTAAVAADRTARQTAEDGAERILALLNDAAFKDPATRPGIKKKIEQEVVALFDFEEFSTRTVGPNWKKFTAQQKQGFKTAFTDLLRNTYIDTLDEYNGQKVQFTGETVANGGKRVEIQMSFIAGEKSYPVAFRMLEKNNAWVVYDVLIEGISMIKNYREQFRDILSKNSPDDLIRRVQAKAEEQKTKKQAAK
ncbi:MAG: MlaC/ttg2D family ABC transporter substrate-binding protein [Desulfovibrio sp.]|jgi:phospholipid transport system substrate-binding protein|nr:ABC transporter substrate-binding protein [Mailhella sp.]